MQMLSQLSYRPSESVQLSREFVVGGPVYALLLVVARPVQAQQHLASALEFVCREPVALVRVWAIEREHVDLARRVKPSDETGTRAATRVQARVDDHAVAGRPLDLDAEQPAGQIEDEVCPLVGIRAVHPYAELYRFLRDRRLGNCTLLSRRQH